MHRISRYSPKKNFGRNTKRRKVLNFEKNNPYSLDSRVIERKAKKDVRLFFKHKKRMSCRVLRRLQEKTIYNFFVIFRHLLVILIAVKEFEYYWATAPELVYQISGGKKTCNI